MTLRCVAASAVLLWSTTVPIDPRLVPTARSMELRVEVCALGERVTQVETAYVLDDRVIGEVKVERVCLRDGKRAGSFECFVDPPEDRR